MKRLTPSKITTIYLVFGCLWIIFSDRLVEHFVTNIETLTRLQTFKGWFFIFFTACLVYVLIKRNNLEMLRAKDDLAKRDHHYLSLIENLSGGYFLFSRDPQGSFVYLSPSIINVLGYEYSEAGLNYQDILVDDPINQQAKNSMALGNKGECPPSYEALVRHKDGSRRSLLISEIPQKDSMGKVIAVEGIAQDITPQKQIENDLRLSENRFRKLVNSAADSIFVHDLDGRILDVNDRACENLGYSRDELLSMNVADIDVEFKPHEDPEILWSKVSDKNLVTLEGVHKRKDGTNFPVEVRIGIFEHEGSEAMLALAREISDRKKVEKETADHIMVTSTVADIGMALSTETAIRPMLQKCVEALQCHTKAAFGRIWTINEKENCLELQGSAGMYTRIDGHHSRKSLDNENKIGSIVLSKKPYLSNNIVGDPQIVDQDWVKREKMVAFAGHPLQVGDRVVGVMALFSRQSLSALILNLLGSVADEIAIGIVRHQTSQALKANEEKLKAIIETIPNPLFYKDIKGVYQGCNKAFSEYLGVSREKIINSTAYDIAPKELADTYHKADSELMAKGGKQVYEARVRYADGLDRDVIFNKAAIFNEQRQVEGLVGLMLDITERKRSEDETNRLRDLLKNMIDSMPSVMVCIDTKGCVLQWNAAAEKMTGLSATEVLGKDLLKVFPLLADILQDTADIIERRSIKKMTKEFVNHEKQKKYAEISVFPLIIQKEVTGAVIRIDDVTDKRRVEGIMLQTEKMMTVGGLAAGMAHEINNPLAGILQNAQVIKNRMSADNAKNREVADQCGLSMAELTKYLENRDILTMLELIMDSGKRAAKIVRNMLNFSRKDQDNFTSHDLKELMEKSLELAISDYDLKKKYDFRQIEIVRQYEDGLPPVCCEESQIQQVILNILKNGAQAMQEAKGEEGEELKASPRFIIRLGQEENKARLEIEDNGPGMGENIKRHIFEPFFTTKEVGQGTGLGLSVAYYIITENHGGTLFVESSPGTGTRFIIKLPFERGF